MSKKALIVFPTFAGVYPRPLQGFLEIACAAGRACPDWRFAFHTPERQSLVTAMTGAANIVLRQGFDAMIMFDDDCFPPFDTIPRLLAHYEAGHPFVAGMGIMRNFPHTTTVGRWLNAGPGIMERAGGVTSFTGFKWLDTVPADAGLIDVDFCGVPVAVVARSVFETVPAPWYGLVSEEDGGTVTHDVYFCQKIAKHGLPIKVDTTLKCGHLAEAPIVTFANRGLVRELQGGE